MDATGQVQMIVTDTAIAEIRRLMALQQMESAALRVGVKGGGCSGLSYTLNFDTEIGPHDQVFEPAEGIKLLVDSKSGLYLNGITLDFQRTIMGGSFKFINPSAKSSCGCGESFSA